MVKTEKNPVCVGVIGAGMISDIYLKNMIGRFPQLSVKAIGSAGGRSAQKKAKEYGISAMSVDGIMEDPEIEMIVNLTPVQHHYEIIKRALLSGKHVYTEKTLTDDLAKAAELLDIARRKELFLGSAPDTFLGASLQTVRKAITDGKIGRITSVAACANRQNDIMLSFYPFLRAPGCGTGYDYAVYYITAMVSLLGPVCRVAAFTDNPVPEHTNINPDSPDYGKKFVCENESRICALLKFKSGVTGTFQLNANSIRKDQGYFSVHGTEGILYPGNPDKFGGKVTLAKNNSADPKITEFEELAPVNIYTKNSRGIGPADMADAIRQNREPRASAELSYHVLEVLDAIIKSGEEGDFYSIRSECRIPAPMPVMEAE